MRIAVWLLVLVNLGLYAYFNSADLFGMNTVVKSEQISPEKIILLRDADIEKMPKKTADTSTALVTAATVADAKMSCFEWGSFSKASILNAQKALTTLSVTSKVKLQNSQEALRYWVYIPRLRSHAAAEAKVAELSALGVTDVFIVQEAKWKDAISLGVFSDEKLATQHLEDLKKKGLTNVAKRLRDEEQGHASLVTSAISATVVEQINALKPDFLGSELKKVECNAL